MEEVKVIPCLDIKEGRVVKGIKFVNLRDARDPVEAAQTYCREGADELVFLDIFATVENRKTRLEWVKKVCEVVTVPFASLTIKYAAARSVVRSFPRMSMNASVVPSAT